MQNIARERVRQVAERHEMTLVEVLGKDQFDEFHLPGAINVPLDEDFDDRIREAVPDKHRGVVVYCHDSECPVSGEAGDRMEEMGYEHVYDYDEGKMDWKQAGLPVEV